MFGTTPVALMTKSQPNVFPLVSWTYSGHDSPVGGTKKDQGLGRQQIHFTHELQASILTILWVKQFLEGDEFFHLTLTFQ